MLRWIIITVSSYRMIVISHTPYYFTYTHMMLKWVAPLFLFYRGRKHPQKAKKLA